MLAALDRVEARDDLARRLEEQYDLELMEEAMRRVRARVEGLSGSEAARRIPMNEPMVFVARGRVLRLLREEVRRLEADGQG